MGLIADVLPGPVAVDTTVFLYFIEDHPTYAPIVAPIFEAMEAEQVKAVTSSLTLLEVLVVPYRSGQQALADRYEALLRRSRGLRVGELTHDVLRGAAQLRAVMRGLRTPDALQLSTALVHGCRSFVTNDARLPAIPGLTVCHLASYLDPPSR